MKIERKTISLSIKSAEEGGTFVGYASTWTTTPDSYGDIVIKGAFEKTLKEWEEKGRPVPIHWNHDLYDANNFIGKCLSIGEDDHGLRVEGKLFTEENPHVKYIHHLMKEGVAVEMSFAFNVLQDKKRKDGVRELHELELFEVSVVPIGANRDTSIDSVKTPEQEASAFTDEQIEALKALADEWIADHADEQGETDDQTNEDGNGSGGGQDPKGGAQTATMEAEIKSVSDELMQEIASAYKLGKQE